MDVSSPHFLAQVTIRPAPHTLKDTNVAQLWGRRQGSRAKPGQSQEG